MLYNVIFYKGTRPVKVIEDMHADSKSQAFDFAQAIYRYCNWDFKYTDMIALDADVRR